MKIDPSTGQRQRITVADTCKWHENGNKTRCVIQFIALLIVLHDSITELRWLIEEISVAGAKRESVIVFTHHAPTFVNTARPEFINSEVKEAFASDLRDLFGDPIVAWFFGHTVSDLYCHKRLFRHLISSVYPIDWK